VCSDRGVQKLGAVFGFGGGVQEREARKKVELFLVGGVVGCWVFFFSCIG
jgi:hypothetical protein